MNQREKAPKVGEQVEQPAEEVGRQAEQRAVETPEEAPEKPAVALGEILLRAEKAYAAYIDAQKEVA